MLEGKMPVSMASTATSNGSPKQGEIVYQDKIIYRDG